MPKRRQNWYNFLFNPGVLVTLFLFFYFVWLIRGDLAQYFGLVAERQALQRGIAEEELKKQRNKLALVWLDQESYIERQARLRLGYIKKDEAGYKVY